MRELTEKQQVQEDEYLFPYHYIDLYCTGPVKLYNLDYLNMLTIIKDMLQPFAGKKILDAGCGDGRLCYEMSRENVDIFGIDYSERAVRFARAFNPSVEILCGDLSQMSFLEEFDIIVIVEVIEHIPPKNIASVLKSLSKALKHDGRLLEAPKQGDGWVFLDWKAPIDGGAPSAYKVMRRERPAGAWEDVATAVISEATLVEQPKGKELEYRIVGVNKAGDGEPSNTAMVVL